MANESQIYESKAAKQTQSTQTISIPMYGHAGGPVITVEVGEVEHFQPALVGIFDIIGFGEMMKAAKDLVTFAAHLRFVAKTFRTSCAETSIFEVQGKRSAAEPDLFQVSDTFVVFQRQQMPADVVQFLWNIHHLLFYSILYGLPLRGTVARGDFLVNRTENFFLGPAALEALKYERIQQWAGVCIAPSLSEQLESFGLIEDLHPLLLRYSIPFKPGPTTSQKLPDLAVNWVADAAHYISPKWLPTKFPSADPRHQAEAEEKLANTRSFLEYALRIKARDGHYPSPINRRIVTERLDPDDPTSRRYIRFVLDDEVADKK